MISPAVAAFAFYAALVLLGACFGVFLGAFFGVEHGKRSTIEDLERRAARRLRDLDGQR